MLLPKSKKYTKKNEKCVYLSWRSRKINKFPVFLCTFDFIFKSKKYFTNTFFQREIQKMWLSFLMYIYIYIYIYIIYIYMFWYETAEAVLQDVIIVIFARITWFLVIPVFVQSLVSLIL